MQITEPSFIQKGLDPLVDPHFWITLPDYESARDFLDYAKAELDFYQTQANADRNYGLFLLYMRLFNTSWGFAINKKVEEAERQNDETLPGVFDFLEYVYHELEKAVKREIAMLELYNKQEKIPHRGVEDDQDNVRFWWSWADDRIRIAFESQIKHDAKESEPRWWPGVTEQQKQIFKSDLARVIKPWNDGIDDEGRFKVKSRQTSWVLRALQCCGDLHLNHDVLRCFIDSKGKSFAEIGNISDYVSETKLTNYAKKEAIKALFEKQPALSSM
jgi:hypothetical protein